MLTTNGKKNVSIVKHDCIRCLRYAKIGIKSHTLQRWWIEYKQGAWNYSHHVVDVEFPNCNFIKNSLQGKILNITNINVTLLKLLTVILS